MKKPGRLSLRWSRAREHGISSLNNQRGDVLYSRGDGVPSCDGHLLHYCFGVGRIERDENARTTFKPSFLEELHQRGYDLTTIKFSIHKRNP